MTLLEAHVASCGYGRVVVLEDVKLSVETGEVVAVLGGNGVGKTTLLRAISGIGIRMKGTVLLDGDEISGVRAHHRVRRGVVHVPEGRRIFGGLSVMDNLRVAGHDRRAPAEAEATLAHVFALFPVLEERQHQPGSTLSGGEQQMLAIGRGMMLGPRLLMVDEASLGLSPVMTQRMLRSLREIAMTGVAVLLVEQNARAALGVADRAYVLERGRIMLEGSAAALIDDPRLTSVYLGGGVRAETAQ